LLFSKSNKEYYNIKHTQTMSDPVKYNPEQVIDKVEPTLAYAEYDG